MEDNKDLKELLSLKISERDEDGEPKTKVWLNVETPDEILEAIDGTLFALNTILEKTGISEDPSAVSVILSGVKGFDEAVLEAVLNSSKELQDLIEEAIEEEEDKEVSIGGMN